MPVTAQMVGLEYLDELQDRISTFKEDVYVYFKNQVNLKWKDKLLAYNKLNLDEGIRPDGTEIEKTPTGNQQSTKYERYTIYLKRKRGEEIGIDSPVTLQGETHGFVNSIDVQVGDGVIYFIDRNWKSDILQTIWGNVLGITEEQLFEFTEWIYPQIENWAVKRLRLKS